ncbi:hypothetical protein SAMN05421803_14316 [Nocardiopsis flavescens]|uniref:Uncharacterized protein n=1 Tax=Nocardiopsis flavescens TaxID=758803 RepID=A0A1M6WFQ0_9ACTN|nr:hypothetical protein SAMN05421803_14316 [Nocardiopsis flavescens]
MIGTVLGLAALAVATATTGVLLAVAGPSVYTDRPLPAPRLRLRFFRRASRRADR